MLITIASGKGGTGKTTIAVNLALIIKEMLPVMLLDCDVEEPNAHLFLQPSFTQHRGVFTTVPKVDETKCDGCGRCSSFCAYGAIAIVEKQPIIFPELCHSCGGCSLVCPTEAITEIPRKIGSVETGAGKGIQITKGSLAIGSPLAPVVVNAVRDTAPANHRGRVVIIDASPGTSCSVVAAVQNTDFCLLVTEPTPFGLHDLALAVELATKLQLPYGVVINRSGLGDSGVYDYCSEARIPILMEIPFDTRYASCYAKGGLLVEAFPDLKEQFHNLWDRIRDRLASDKPPYAWG
ncbi:MAG: P-loop NTPase [Firmicutes bacterium]|nr:P-loop NTPase [Bacillota bacterium]